MTIEEVYRKWTNYLDHGDREGFEEILEELRSGRLEFVVEPGRMIVRPKVTIYEQGPDESDYRKS